MSIKETEAITKVLKTVQGDYIPTHMELKTQEGNVAALDKIDIDKHPDRWNKVYNQCTEFENKYC